MTYNINAKIEYDYGELKKYGLGIRNVSITCNELKDRFFEITGDLIVIDSKKADKYTSYDIIYTVYGNRGEASSKHTMVSTYKQKKKTFKNFFFIPFDYVDAFEYVDKITISVKKRDSSGANMEFFDIGLEMEWMEMQLEHEMDMMDPWDFL